MLKRPGGHCGRAERTAVGVGITPALVLVAFDRVRLDPSADVSDRLLGEAAVRRRERLPLSTRVVARLGERHPARASGLRVRSEQEFDLRFERNLEWVLLDRRLERAVRGRATIEPNAVAKSGG
jgi:hypothetical protein